MKKGLTLVALVITIIILLILTTVTVSMLIGDNGMVKKSRESKEKTEITQIVERLNNASAATITDIYYGELTNIGDLAAVRAKLIQNDAKDSDIINAMVKPNPAQDIYTINYTSTNGNWLLVYTLNLITKAPSYVISAIP